MLQTIGRTIRSLRRERGLSQELLAGMARIDRSYMSSIERGLRNVSVLNMARIAVALNVPMRDLLGPREVRPAGLGHPVDLRQAPAAAEPEVSAEHEVNVEWEPGRYLSLS